MKTIHRLEPENVNDNMLYHCLKGLTKSERKLAQELINKFMDGDVPYGIIHKSILEQRTK